MFEAPSLIPPVPIIDMELLCCDKVILLPPARINPPPVIFELLLVVLLPLTENELMMFAGPYNE